MTTIHAMRHRANLVVAVALGLACVVPNPELAREDEAADTSMSSDGAADSSDTASGSFTDSSADSSVDSSSDVDAGSDAGPDSSSDASETGMPDLAEEPLCPLLSEVGDGCQTCVDLYCCSAIELCQIDQDCTCLLDCLLSGSVTTICEATCGLGSNLPSLSMTLDCLDQHCSEDCPNTL